MQKITEPTERLIWLDVETFGLDRIKDPIIEIGLKITNLELEVTSVFHEIVWNAMSESRYQSMQHAISRGEADENTKFIFELHTKNGLFDYARECGRGGAAVLRDLLRWFDLNEVNKLSDPLCGSTVSFDRDKMEAQYPGSLAGFSYRNVDISSLKELCMRYNPEMFQYMARDVKQQKQHRVMPDLTDSIEEFRWYRDNFLWIKGVDL